MKRALLLCLVLAGCATAEPQIVTQTVKVPVPVSCVTPSQIPAKPDDRFARTAPASPLDDQVRALLLDRESGQAYAGKLRAVLESCVEAGNPVQDR